MSQQGATSILCHQSAKRHVSSFAKLAIAFGLKGWTLLAAVPAKPAQKKRKVDSVDAVEESDSPPVGENSAAASTVVPTTTTAEQATSTTSSTSVVADVQTNPTRFAGKFDGYYELPSLRAKYVPPGTTSPQFEAVYEELLV